MSVVSVPPYVFELNVRYVELAVGAERDGGWVFQRAWRNKLANKAAIRWIESEHLIVKRIDEEEKSKGGIIIPDTAKEKPQEGKVVAVGKGKVNDDGKITPLDVKINDRVLFGKYSGSEINIDGEEHLIMREDEVLAVVEGK